MTFLLHTLRTGVGPCIEDLGLSGWVTLDVELDCIRVFLTLLHKVQEWVDHQGPLAMEDYITWPQSMKCSLGEQPFLSTLNLQGNITISGFLVEVMEFNLSNVF